MTEHLDTDLLHRHFLGALSEAEQQEASSHLATCARCRTALEALEEDRAQFESRVFAQTLPTIEARLQPRAPVFRWVAWAGLPALAVAAALVLVVQRADPPAPYLGWRGGPTLQLYVKRGGEVRRWSEARPLLPGDTLRFTANGAGCAHLAIAARELDGSVALVVPDAVLGNGTQELEGAFRVEERGAPERLYAWFSDAPLDGSEVLRELRARPDAPAPESKCRVLQLHLAGKRP